jgi:hypothetical protein
MAMIAIMLSVQDCGDNEYLVRAVEIDGTFSTKMARGFDGAISVAVDTVALLMEAERPNPTPGKVVSG